MLSSLTACQKTSLVIGWIVVPMILTGSMSKGLLAALSMAGICLASTYLAYNQHE